MNIWEEIGMALILGSVAILAAWIFIIAIVYVPRSAYVNQKCLEAGYPKSEVIWNLDGYCFNLEGTVTVKVEKLNAKR